MNTDNRSIEDENEDDENSWEEFSKNRVLIKKINIEASIDVLPLISMVMHENESDHFHDSKSIEQIQEELQNLKAAETCWAFPSIDTEVQVGQRLMASKYATLFKSRYLEPTKIWKTTSKLNFFSH